MAEHTPTPWKVTVDGRAGEIIRAADSTGRPIASMWINGDDMKANAALIVCAVNSHDALVKALTDVRYWINRTDKYALGTVWRSNDDGSSSMWARRDAILADIAAALPTGEAG